MRVFMNNIEVIAGQVSAVDLGFGRTGGMDLFPYCIEIPKKEFNEVFKKAYEELVIELKRDDEITGEFDPPYPGAKTYPELFELPLLSGEYLTDYIHLLRENIWWEYFWGKEAELKYVVQTWDRVEFIDDMFMIYGLARHPS